MSCTVCGSMQAFSHLVPLYLLSFTFKKQMNKNPWVITTAGTAVGPLSCPCQEGSSCLRNPCFYSVPYFSSLYKGNDGIEVF